MIRSAADPAIKTTRLRTYKLGSKPPASLFASVHISDQITSCTQLVQYINLVRPDGSANSQANGDYYDSPGGKRYYFVDADEYGDDYAAGHGTHTAGSAVGATISSPANMTTCPSDRVLSCAGGCIDEYGLYGDDLVSYTSQTSALADLDRLCPKFDCDGMSSDVCLSDDTGTVLADHGGMARGAKLSTFDVFAEDSSVGTYLPGNGLWQPPLEIGGRLHSNSWGGDLDCRVDAFDIMYDTFMYEVSDQSCPSRQVYDRATATSPEPIATRWFLILQPHSALVFLPSLSLDGTQLDRQVQLQQLC